MYRITKYEEIYFYDEVFHLLGCCTVKGGSWLSMF